MFKIVEHRTSPLSHVRRRPSTFNWKCSPISLQINVTGKHADAEFWDNGHREKLFDIPWAVKVDDIISRIEGLQNALERFRERWSDAYLDAIDGGDEFARLEFSRLLDSSLPLCDWENPTTTADAAHDRCWEVASTSPELRTLAIEGHRLYVLLFEGHSGLKAWMQRLPPGSHLQLDWTKAHRSEISSLPWGLMYQGSEPKVGEAVEPLRFFGLKYRLEYIETWSNRSPWLGRESNRGHVFFWKGPGQPEYDEAHAQHRSWSKMPNYHAAPDSWPPAANDELHKSRALEILKGEDPPMNLLYLYCQCDFKGKKPELYFGNPNGPGVTLLEVDLPDPSVEFPCHPLVFVNACRSNWPVGVFTANLLKSNFLDRGCRAYLGAVNRVPVRLASRFAESFFHFFLPKDGATTLSAGEAVSQARLFLWFRYKNIGGLFYNYLNKYDIILEDE